MSISILKRLDVATAAPNARLRRITQPIAVSPIQSRTIDSLLPAKQVRCSKAVVDKIVVAVDVPRACIRVPRLKNEPSSRGVGNEVRLFLIGDREILPLERQIPCMPVSPIPIGLREPLPSRRVASYAKPQ